jgi:hypothetical protein
VDFPRIRLESMLGTNVITTTGTATKTAPTGVTWWHSAGSIVSTTGSTTERSGIGATVISGPRLAKPEESSAFEARWTSAGSVVQGHFVESLRDRTAI